MDSVSALHPLTVDVHFMNLVMNFLLGQQVTLDIILPPYGGMPPQSRPPTVPTSWVHPQTSFVMRHVHQFQSQWPMPVQGLMDGRRKIRITFCHLTFSPLIRYGAVCHFWLKVSLHSAKRLAHINLNVPRGLPASYQLVDTIVWHDSESDLHKQTDCEILSTLKCTFVRTPI